VLGVRLDTGNLLVPTRAKISPPSRNEAFCAAVAAEFDSTDYSFEDAPRAVHSHGQATADEVYQALYGHLERTVDMVFFCRTEQAAVRLTQLAQQHDVCLIPYGGGTNVTGALTLPKHERRMIVSVDMRPLCDIVWINKRNRQVCVQAGITGTELERKLTREGYTSGHEPDSQELSTLGGWISTNASGMKRHRYGGIEDIVEQITLVTPNGELQTLDAFPRQSVGVQVRPALFGSEGNFGLITEAVLRIRELPEATVFQSLVFPNFERGVEFLRELSGTSFLPASIRLVDNTQFRFGQALKAEDPSPFAHARSRVQRAFLTRIKGIDLKQMCAATLVMEGAKNEVRSQQALVGELAAKHRGFYGGGGNGKHGYNLTFAIAYIRDFLTKLSVMGETMETTAPWDRIHDICEAVKREAARLHSEFAIPGTPFVSFRITQLYVTGVCLYVTYGVCTHGLDGAHIAREADHRLRGAIVKAGGAISNHHGVGKFRADLLEQKLTPPSDAVIRSMKSALDPQNVFGVANGVFCPKG
jgi:alkyldihydroxyacetonephosphate synthase